MSFLRSLLVGVLVAALLAIGVGALASSAASSPQGPDLVFATGFERGAVSPETELGLRTTGHPSVVMEWQSALASSGVGAYHLVGGRLSHGDADIQNTGNKRFPLGGLEVWTGGAFNFVSFPRVEPVWIMTTVPTDGQSRGADDKPVVKIGVDGRLILDATNVVPGLAPAFSRTVVERGAWYYLVIHGRHGVDQEQELYVYDGTTHRLIEVVRSRWTVGGSYSQRLAKWGFGTSQDSTGLEYYLDDIAHFTGSVNPGPVRVLPKVAVGTAAGGDFATTGAPVAHEAVSEAPVDGDRTYIRTGSATRAAREVRFALSPASLQPGDVVYAVQAVVVARHAGTEPKTVSAVGVGLARSPSQETVAPVAVLPSYSARRALYLLDPFTSAAWSAGAVDTLGGVIRDTERADVELRVTRVSWEVVYAPAARSAPAG